MVCLLFIEVQELFYNLYRQVLFLTHIYEIDRYISKYINNIYYMIHTHTHIHTHINIINISASLFVFLLKELMLVF